MNSMINAYNTMQRMINIYNAAKHKVDMVV